MRISFLVLAICALLTGVSHATLIVDVGDHELRPNTPNQPIPVLVRSDGGPRVVAFNLNARIGDGLGAQSEPVFSAGNSTMNGVDFMSGSVWPSGQVVETGDGTIPEAPQFASSAVAVNSPDLDVLADGVLLTLLVDTTGFDAGVYDLRLADTEAPDSNFVLTGGRQFSPEIRNGRIAIVPEPGTLAMLWVAAGLFAGMFRRR